MQCMKSALAYPDAGWLAIRGKDHDRVPAAFTDIMDKCTLNHLLLTPSEQCCRCARLCHAVAQSGQIVTDASTAGAIVAALTGSDEPDFASISDDAECSWGSSSSRPNQEPVPAIPMCFNACLDIATCYAGQPCLFSQFRSLSVVITAFGRILRFRERAC